jgi:hypothetical protein
MPKKMIQMKYMKYLFMGAMALALFSCSDDKLNEIGKNPNDPTEVPSNLLISQSTLTSAFEIAGADLAWYCSVFSEQTVGVHGQLEEADKRTGINSTIGGNSWDGAYATTLKDLKVVIDMCSAGGSEEGNYTTRGIAKVLSAYCYSVLTDIWGEVPFSEAVSGVAQPAFDNQDNIYLGLLAMLNDGIADLNQASIGDPGEFDFYYGGDADAWIAAAYAFKARLFNRMSNHFDEATYSTYNDSILEAVSMSFASSADDMAFTSFGAGSSEQNPWFQEEADRGHHAVSQTIFDIMDGLNDPRMDIWFDLLGGSIVPAPPGSAIPDQGHEIYSRIIVAADDPIPIITYDEIKFIEAEAYLRASDRPSAYASYLAAIEAAMVRAGIAQGLVDTYIAQGSVSVGQANLTEEDIITQKYISFYLYNAIEAYNDYRRTGIPTMHNSVGPPPNRFPYTDNEVATNPNVPDFTSVDKVWWAL